MHPNAQPLPCSGCRGRGLATATLLLLTRHASCFSTWKLVKLKKKAFDSQMWEEKPFNFMKITLSCSSRPLHAAKEVLTTLG